MPELSARHRDLPEHLPIVIGDRAPLFATRTTMGERKLSDYRGRWLTFFSHPADFTPVCTSEFLAFAKAFDRFQALQCELLGLSVDSLHSHFAWVRSIQERFGVEVPFPIAEDPSMAIATAYGMLRPDALDSSSVRATFVIDPNGIVRAISWYPMSVGRSVDEIARLVEALQTAERDHALAPEGWRSGDPLFEPTPLSIAELSDYVPTPEEPDWYYRRKRL